MTSLDELAIAHGTDKSSRFHNYSSIYENLFEPLRESARRVLEIGVCSSTYEGGAMGGSLKMWAEYFGHAEVFGIDIDPVCAQVAAERVHVRIGGQDDPKFLQQVCAELGASPDIIIDDGSHINRLTLRSFELLFPRLRPGGWYILEDMHVTYNRKWRGTFKKILRANRRRPIDRFLTRLINNMDLYGKGHTSQAIQDFLKIPPDKQAELSEYERWVGQIHLYQGYTRLRNLSSVRFCF